MEGLSPGSPFRVPELADYSALPQCCHFLTQGFETKSRPVTTDVDVAIDLHVERH